ncbi:MAG TPA: hypothetical protein PKD78_10545 [Saprospiraceae bacterium]|nr:hypothetical protein [Saprospiraceae bacterium]
MKHTLIICFFSLLAATPIHAQEDPLPVSMPKGIFDNDVTLKAGTLVLLETSEKVQSSQVTVGKTLQFRVCTNVMAQGRVAIRGGALAMGRVKAIEPYTFNSPEQIRIELLYVQAADGQMIPLNGNEQTIKGQFPGQDASIEVGTAITAHVTNTVEIKID